MKREVTLKCYDGIYKQPYEIIKKSSKKNYQTGIVIRCKNEEKKIGECLEEILKQKECGTYDIIVIDSGSTDKTLDIVKKYDVSVYAIPADTFQFGSSISLGLFLCKGKYCAFLSAHAIPKNEFWLKNLLNKFDDQTVAVYSKQIYYEDTFFIEKKSLEDTFGPKSRFQSKNKEMKKFSDYKEAIIFSNASSCILKEVAEKIPFRNLIASEDREWAFRVLQHGYGIKYAADSEIYHCHNETLDQYYKRIYINSKALYEFAGVKILWYHFFPLFFLKIFQDTKFLLKTRDFSLKNLKISFRYRYQYVLAHYKATRE